MSHLHLLPHFHNNEQGKFALMHLHQPLQPAEHPHFITARHAAPAGGSSIHLTSHKATSFFRAHPKSDELGWCGALDQTLLHI